MTKREYLEHVRDWFTRTQKFGWDMDRRMCLYRHPTDPDCRCAVGCSIPDDAYDPHMEDTTLFGLVADARRQNAQLPIVPLSDSALAWLNEIDTDKGLVEVMVRVQQKHDTLADAGAMDEFLAYVDYELAALEE